MDALEKIKQFSLNMPFESAEDVNTSLDQTWCSQEIETLREKLPVTHAHLPNGKTIRLLKTMQTSVCEKDCNYCCFRSGRDTPRASLTPDELASAVVKLSHAGIAQGVFLSSGITGGGIRTQDRIIATAEILRKKFHYTNYIHLKIMPGAEKDQILRAMQLADRVSINLEGPNETAVNQLAPHKVFYSELLEPLHIIYSIRQEYPPHMGWNGRWPSSCTQFVVGAVGEKDLDLLQTTSNLFANFEIRRVYYSKFTPVINTPFENLPALNALRQHRLYKAFYMLRDYGFDLEEMPLNQNGNLMLESDPKTTWADATLRESPVEINLADFQELIKIPGIGPITAKKILEFTARDKIRDIQVLKKMGTAVKRAAKYILLDGVRPAYQPGLFNEIT
jgi:predicted DNA-binding helix-hairpin-helix protein